MKKSKIPKRFFEGMREEIVRVLIEELQEWKSTTKVSSEEIMRICDRLFHIKNSAKNETHVSPQKREK